uniref:Uncharacterized protein n=1 Tax=Nomascus leucogenys TaxID=61853 RepID=A0A2I3GPL1_NOMLE
QWNSADVGTGATDNKRKKINNGTNPETTTSGGCRSPEDKQQNPAQLEEEKKASHQHQQALRRQLEAQVHTIQILMCQKTELEIALYYSQDATRKFEGGNLGTSSSFNLALSQSKDLAGCLHHSWNFAGELQRALSAVSTQHKHADRVSPTTCPVPWEPSFADGGMSLKVPPPMSLFPFGVQTNTLQEEKMWRQEEKLQDQEKIRKQKEKMWRQQEERLRQQEKQMREEEKMREQEKMWRQEEKLRKQEKELRELEERRRCGRRRRGWTSHPGSVEPARGAGDSSPHDNCTAQQIMQLLPGTKNAHECPVLGSTSCIPFFYRGDKKKMKIINI